MTWRTSYTEMWHDKEDDRWFPVRWVLDSVNRQNLYGQNVVIEVWRWHYIT